MITNPIILVCTLDLHVHVTCNTLPVTQVQLMRPCIGQNVSCALGDCLTSTCRPKGHLRPWELWFSIYSSTCTCTGGRMYRKSGNFRVIKLSLEAFSCLKNFIGQSLPMKIFYNKRLPPYIIVCIN